MNEAIEYGEWIKYMHRYVVAAGSPFAHGLLHAYQSTMLSLETSEGPSLISPRLHYKYNVKKNYILKV